jgi:hypothetical protein
MTVEPPPVHTWQLSEGQSGRYVVVYRRCEGIRIEQVMLISINSAELDPERIGPALCEAADRELHERNQQGRPH